MRRHPDGTFDGYSPLDHEVLCFGDVNGTHLSGNGYTSGYYSRWHIDTLSVVSDSGTINEYGSFVWLLGTRP
jgi:hypothetical protein